MTLKRLLLITITLLTSSIISCTTYYIPVDSFRQQLPSLDKAGPLRRVTAADPYGVRSTYDTYPIDSIKCLDKNGKWYLLKNSPSLEIRFTDNNNKKTTFYFDQIYVLHDSITGLRSHILSLKKTIPLSNVKTIEIQDGHKKFRYVN